MAPAEGLLQSTGTRIFKSRVTSIVYDWLPPCEVIQNPKKQPVLVYARDTMVAINKNGI